MSKIPKIIHYCWVGGNPKPQSVLYCIESWKRFCPDYEIREWNETNYDFSKNEYMREAYEAEKWGFVPDYARLDIIYQHGGIYLDTDVEMVRSFDELLENECFFGFEDTGEGEYYVACGLGFGSTKNNDLIKKLRDYYDCVRFRTEDGKLNLKPAPRHNAGIFAEFGVRSDNSFQNIEGNVFYPAEYFCPKIFSTGRTRLTEKTFSIHHFSASWMDEKVKKEMEHRQKTENIFGGRMGGYILFAESAVQKYGSKDMIAKLPAQAVKKAKQGLISLKDGIPYYLGLMKAKAVRPGKGPLILLDTGMKSDNRGDGIIMESCIAQLSDFIDGEKTAHISTHIFPSEKEKQKLCSAGRKILCGTNILSGNMRRYGLWKLGADVSAYRNTVLMGVGFDSKDKSFDGYTKQLMRTILCKDGFHSVRDSFSESKLKAMGIKNVLNTGCPTMWNLTPDLCSKIPASKASKVICTVTDYKKDETNDKIMLDILLESYEKVYLWLQGKGDLEYIRALGYEEKVQLIESTLEAYDAVLSMGDVDYVGTRLHAGIRAISKGRRSLVVSIDNRAECISADTGLPVIKREDIPVLLKNRLTGEIETKIVLPRENIEKWKKQFAEEII